MVTGNRNSLTLSIGGISTVISSESEEFMAQTKERYAKFFADGLDPALKIELEVLAPENVQRSPISFGESPEVSLDRSKGGSTIAWHGLSGKFDSRTGEGKLRCPLSPASLNSFLRFVYSLVLVKEPGFLVHASSLIRNGKGYVFPGESGAGKTTIAQLSPDSTLLTDDISLVKIVNGEFTAFGTPFWGALAIGGENISAPITGVYFPIKDRKNCLKRLKPKQALERLLPHVVFFAKDNEFSKQLFMLCCDFVTKVPGYELYFLPQSSFWRCVDSG